MSDSNKPMWAPDRASESQASELARLRNQNQALREELAAHVEICAASAERVKALEDALQVLTGELHSSDYCRSGHCLSCETARALLEEKP